MSIYCLYIIKNAILQISEIKQMIREIIRKTVFRLDWQLNKLGISLATFLYNDFANIKQFNFIDTNISNIFQKIHEKNFWKNEESISGYGSTKKRASPYLKYLKIFLLNYKIKTFLDIPCGDLNWISNLKIAGMQYMGCDIVEEIIKKNKIKYPSLKFEVLDITRDKLPSADILHCRDCLFHLSYNDIKRAIKNFLNSDIDYILLTSHEGFFKNNDITTGGSRFLSFLKKPFFFPKPILKIKDYPPLKEMPRYLYLYKRDDLKKYELNLN